MVILPKGRGQRVDGRRLEAGGRRQGAQRRVATPHVGRWQKVGGRGKEAEECKILH